MTKNKTTIPIAEKADILHRTASLYMASNIPIDYGTGELYTSVEMHMLKYIADHPGKTVTELAVDWDKTKAAISQMLKKLETKELIYKKNAPDSLRKQCFFITEKGKQLNSYHQKYDTKVFGKTLDLLEELCTAEEIETCFSVLEKYTQARQKKHYNFDLSQANRRPLEGLINTDES